MLPGDEAAYELLSINYVSRMLRIGRSKIKKLISNGLIESVECAGKIMIPRCKLDKYINGNNGSQANTTSLPHSYDEDEDEVSRIFSEINNE